jgi:HEPN domain-containing protein
MDENKRIEWESWIKRSLNDYYSAKKLVSGEDKYLDTGIYHCQQAAEKILKSFLVYNNIHFEKIHSIVYLINKCVKINKKFEELFNAAEVLTPYVSAFRYPGENFEPESEDVDEALDHSKKIINFVIQEYIENDDYDEKLIK